MVWLLRPAVFAVVLAVADCYLPGQEPAAPTQGQERTEFFSGTVADLPAGKVIVSRNSLGKAESRTFIIGPDTKVEGKLRARARVTVRYRTSDQGDVAVHIIVRSGQPGPPKKS